ncbi:thioredoxin domain-containing protein [Aquirufa sp. ROCK-SH2]
MKNLKLTSILTLFIAFVSFGALAQVEEVDGFEQKLKSTPNALLLDVRTSGEFGGGHLPNAKNIDFRSPDFATQIKSLDKNKPVLIYCLSGGRSAQAAELMRKEGFTVTEMKGGYLKWTTKMKPLEGVPNVKHDQAWDKKEFDKVIAKDEAVVVDFFAKWCAPCIKMMPTVDKLAKDYEGKVTVLKVEADGNQAILQAYGIDEIPGFLVFQKGKLVLKTAGFRVEAQLKELFDTSLK